MVSVVALQAAPQTITPESYGAQGDGTIASATASITSGQSVLTVSLNLFNANDVGKYIEIPGAGAAGATLFSTIASFQSRIQVTLADVASTTLSAVAGTILAYGHDDTIAFQAALNTNKFVELTADKVYLVQNINLGNVAPRGFAPAVGIVCRSGTAIIRAKSGGDASYLACVKSWLNNTGFANYPVMCSNVLFDGASIVQDVFADVSFGSIFDKCQFVYGLRYGHVDYGVGKDGITSVVNNVVNQQFLDCQFSFNGSHGLYNDGHATDTQVIGGYSHDNSGYQAYFGQSAGLQMEGFHTYDAANKSLWLEQFGLGSGVTGCYFEGDVVINSVNSTARYCEIGPANAIGGQLKCMGSVGVSGNILTRSVGNEFYGTGNIYQGYNGPSRTVISQGDTFLTATPFVWNGGAVAQGVIIAVKSFSWNGAFANAGFYDGIQYPSAVNEAANQVPFIKALSNTGTTTTITATITVASYANAGFSMRGTLDIWSIDSTSTNVEDYSCDLNAKYVRKVGSATSAKKAAVLNPDSTGAGVSAAIAITDATTTGNDTVTLTITITHPQSPDTTSSKASVLLNFGNRSVSGITLA